MENSILHQILSPSMHTMHTYTIYTFLKDLGPHIKGIGRGLFSMVAMGLGPTAEAQYKLPTQHTLALLYGFSRKMTHRKI